MNWIYFKEVRTQSIPHNEYIYIETYWGINHLSHKLQPLWALYLTNINSRNITRKADGYPRNRFEIKNWATYCLKWAKLKFPNSWLGLLPTRKYNVITGTVHNTEVCIIHGITHKEPPKTGPSRTEREAKYCIASRNLPIWHFCSAAFQIAPVFQ